MGLLLYSNALPLTTASSRSSSQFPPSSSSSSSVTAAISRIHMKPIGPHPKSFIGVQLYMPVAVKRSASVLVKASSDIDGTGSSEGNEPPLPDSGKEEGVPIDKLPLESKLQERLEQKTRMKLAKKIRLRRKRLVQKRKLRKKGRWPPSKMKKLKNV